jgi:hypothetical protein
VHFRNRDVYSVEEVHDWLDRTGWRSRIIARSPGRTASSSPKRREQLRTPKRVEE